MRRARGFLDWGKGGEFCGGFVFYILARMLVFDIFLFSSHINLISATFSVLPCMD